MSNQPYQVKARPDLSLMEAILNGGGCHEPIQREAYWAVIPSETPDSLHSLELAHEITPELLKRKV